MNLDGNEMILWWFKGGSRIALGGSEVILSGSGGLLCSYKWLWMVLGNSEVFLGYF